MVVVVAAVGVPSFKFNALPYPNAPALSPTSRNLKPSANYTKNASTSQNYLFRLLAACRRQGSGAHRFGSWLADEVRNTHRGKGTPSAAKNYVLHAIYIDYDFRFVCHEPGRWSQRGDFSGLPTGLTFDEMTKIYCHVQLKRLTYRTIILVESDFPLLNE